jgi:cytochrome b561
VAVVVLHAGAAFYHHLFQNDDTLRRMLPGRRRPAVASPSASTPEDIAP